MAKTGFERPDDMDWEFAPVNDLGFDIRIYEACPNPQDRVLRDIHVTNKEGTQCLGCGCWIGVVPLERREGIRLNGYPGLCERTGKSTRLDGNCGKCPPCENQRLHGKVACNRHPNGCPLVDKAGRCTRCGHDDRGCECCEPPVVAA